MKRDGAELVQDWAGQLRLRSLNRLESLFAESLVYSGTDSGVVNGRRAFRSLLKRWFETHAVFEMHVLKLASDDDLIVADLVYLLGQRKTEIIPLRSLAVIEVADGRITRWADHQDVSEVPEASRALWRRLATARW